MGLRYYSSKNIPGTFQPHSIVFLSLVFDYSLTPGCVVVQKTHITPENQHEYHKFCNIGSVFYTCSHILRRGLAIVTLIRLKYPRLVTIISKTSPPGQKRTVFARRLKSIEMKTEVFYMDVLLSQDDEQGRELAGGKRRGMEPYMQRER